METGSRYHLPAAFQKPKDYNPPKPDDLAGNTYFPELNSQEYRHRAIKCVKNKFLPFFCALDQNDEGQFLLGCNNFHNRVWNSNVFGFDSFEDIINKNEENTSFDITSDSSVTTVKYVSSSMFFVTKQSAEIELWSSKSAMRDTDDYSPFKIGNSVNAGYATELVTMEKENTAVSVSSEGHINLWDYGSADLCSLQVIHHAHSSKANGVSLNPESTDKVFVTCSDDHSCLIWDCRDVLSPGAIGLYEHHKFSFNTVYWTKSTENNGLIMAGDENGNVLTFDIRKPQSIYSQVAASDRAIKNICFNGTSQYGVVSNSNVVKIMNVENDKSTKEIYQNSDAKNFIRGFSWDNAKPNSFYVVGYDFYSNHISF